MMLEYPHTEDGSHPERSQETRSHAVPVPRRYWCGHTSLGGASTPGHATNPPTSMVGAQSR